MADDYSSHVLMSSQVLALLQRADVCSTSGAATAVKENPEQRLTTPVALLSYSNPIANLRVTEVSQHAYPKS